MHILTHMIIDLRSAQAIIPLLKTMYPNMKDLVVTSTARKKICKELFIKSIDGKREKEAVAAFMLPTVNGVIINSNNTLGYDYD